jgi:hypothetical protein
MYIIMLTTDSSDDVSNQEDHKSNDESQEHYFIILSNAIINPVAMMIEVLYASVASKAVSRLWELYNFTEGAETLRIEFSQEQ